MTTKADGTAMVASPAEQRLRDLRVRLGQLGLEGLDMMSIEEGIRAALDELGRELMLEVFRRADLDDQELLINGVLHGRVDRHVATIHTTFGPVEQGRTVYRRGYGTPTVAPFDKIAGIVERFYTPKCAKVLCHLPAVLVRDDAEALLREFGGIAVGAATQHRLPQAVLARYEKQRDLIERTVRERATVPDAAATVQIGMDGVMVPQEGEHAKARGRQPGSDPDPPRHELKYGAMPGGPAANDGSLGRAWHEASVGTLAYFDATGNHLSTTYFGRMPEAKKATLGQMLTDEVLHVFTMRPDLRPVFASDGAEGHWTTLGSIEAKLPDDAREQAVDMLDFFHAAEHLQTACNLIDGEGTPEAHVRRIGWAETLKVHANGVDRVLAALRHQRRIAKSRRIADGVDDVIAYIENNRDRMRYKDAIDAHVPIATGPTEAAAKSLVGVRMKRSGARFSQHGGQTILTLLAAHKSSRFDDLFDALWGTYKAPVRRAA